MTRPAPPAWLHGGVGALATKFEACRAAALLQQAVRGLHQADATRGNASDRAGQGRAMAPAGSVAAGAIALVILAGAVTLVLSAPSGQTCGVTVTSPAGNRLR